MIALLLFMTELHHLKGPVSRQVSAAVGVALVESIFDPLNLLSAGRQTERAQTQSIDWLLHRQLET